MKLPLLVASVFLAVLAPVQASATSGSIVELDGLIEPYLLVNVGSGSPGILASVNVDRDEVVKKGEVLATLESGVEEATMELAKARSEMDTMIHLKRARFEFVERDQALKEDLYNKGVVPFYDKDQAETDKIMAQYDLEDAVEQKYLSELELQQAIKVLERRTIRSPIDGVVVERLLSQGEYVEDKPILKLAQMNPLNVEVVAPVALYGSIKVGMTAEVMPEDPVGGTYEGRVQIVDRVIDAASGTFGVRVQLANPEYRLPAGLKCRVRFLGSKGSG